PAGGGDLSGGLLAQRVVVVVRGDTGRVGGLLHPAGVVVAVAGDVRRGGGPVGGRGGHRGQAAVGVVGVAGLRRAAVGGVPGQVGGQGLGDLPVGVVLGLAGVGAGAGGHAAAGDRHPVGGCARADHLRLVAGLVIHVLGDVVAHRRARRLRGHLLLGDLPVGV